MRTVRSEDSGRRWQRTTPPILSGPWWDPWRHFKIGAGLVSLAVLIAALVGLA
jgi:hypothetical protein